MKRTNMNVRISDDLKRDIEATAQDNYITPSDFVRFSIEAVLDKIKNQ